MHDKSIDITEALERVKFYEENDMEFSALLLWEKILEKEPTEYRKFRYANILRLCGFCLGAEKIYDDIKYDAIPAQSKYFYHLYLGQLYKDMGKKKQAQEQYIICMDFDTCDSVPYVFYTCLLDTDNDNAEAIYYLKIALDKTGDIDEVYYNLSRRLAIKGDIEGALDAISKCLSLDPAYPNGATFKNDLENYFTSKATTIE